MKEAEYVYTITIGGKNYTVYSGLESHLSY